MKCDKVRENISAYIEGLVSCDERKAVEKHLSSCSECSAAVRNLRNTVSLMNNLDEVSPPAWMTQKIMARVREEAAPKRGLFRRLFYPLHIKLPLEAVAAVLVAVISIYIFKSTEPVLKMAELSTQISEDKSASAPSSRPDEFAPLHNVKKGNSPASRSIESAPSSVMAKRNAGASVHSDKNNSRAAGMLEKKKEVSPVPTPPVVAERESSEQAKEFAVKQERETKDEVMMRPEEAFTGQTASAQLKSRKKPIAGSGTRNMRLTVSVKSIGKGVRETEALISKLGGKTIRTRTAGGKTVITAALAARKIDDFLKKLEFIGKIHNEPVNHELRDIVEFSIEIVLIPE